MATSMIQTDETALKFIAHHQVAGAVKPTVRSFNNEGRPLNPVAPDNGICHAALPFNQLQCGLPGITGIRSKYFEHGT